MEHGRLKRFAVRMREKMLEVTDEKNAYISFMRLGAALFAERGLCGELLDMPQSERNTALSRNYTLLAEKFGGIFRLYGHCDMPDVLLSDDAISEYAAVLPEKSDFLGWLHQYFNEPYRSEITVGLKNSRRLSADKIAASTQIFTPEWIAEYLVENTLVRTWQENGCNPPENLTFLDPCMGGGNILLCAFDAFMEMYRTCGYTEKIAANLILERNIFGLELDERAGCVAETALRIKAWQYGADAVPNVFSFTDGECIGSLLSADNCTGCIAELLSRKYDVIVTNPPYLARNAMNDKLLDFVNDNYKKYSSDLFSVFVVRCMELAADNGRLGFLTPYTWLFIRSYEALRRLICSEKSLENLVQFAYSAFENAVVPICAFTFQNSYHDADAHFIRLSDFSGETNIQRKMLQNALNDEKCGYRFSMNAADFLSMPTVPFAYWLSKSVRDTFGLPTVGDIADVREGLITGDNDRFLRRWHEVCSEKIAFQRQNDKKWYLLNKGGEVRRWYGNREYVINWENDGFEIRHFVDKRGVLRSRPQNIEYNFRRAAGWSAITSSAMTVRYYDENFIFNVAGACAFPKDEEKLMWLIALLNSKTASVLTQAVNPTLNMNPGDTARIPMPENCDIQRISNIAEECVELCRQDWDSFEESFDFRKHPLI